MINIFTHLVMKISGVNKKTAVLLDRVYHLEDVLRALLDDDNEATRADAQRALECS